MSHEVESMFYVNETPWHSLGVKLNAPPTTRDAMIAAGMNWEVGLKALQTVDGESVSHKACYRMTDGKILGVVGPGSHPIQNAAAFSWFDPFVQSGEATLETAGSLRGGQRIWVLAKLSRDPSVIVPGDEIQKYILLSNSHDGTMAARVGFTPIRVVCHNTLSMALDSNASKLLRVRHTKNAVDILNAVRDTMNVANASFEATAEQYRRLARTSINGDDLDRYISLVFPKAKSKTPAPPPVMTDVDASGADMLASLLDRPVAANANEETRYTKREEIIHELFESGLGHEIQGVRGTLWGAYNAVTEYTTHHRGSDGETRLQSMFNDGMNINNRALSAAVSMARA
jgi:phage/plasmid-like protein (TIGR03299 family)